MGSGDSGLDLLCIGGASVDLVLRVPHMPERDEKMAAEVAGRTGGGLVANTACSAARLGLRTAWSGLLGDDPDGRMLLDEFAAFGVNTSLAEVRPGLTTDLCVILLEPGGERTILVANTLPGPPPLTEPLLVGVGGTRWVYTLPYELDWLRRLVVNAHEAGSRVALDIEAGGPVSGNNMLQAISEADMVFLSAGGLKKVFGTTEPGEITDTLPELGPKIVVVTQGAQGAWAWRAGETCEVPGIRVPVIDTTGAGDCFHAAFLTAHIHGMPLERSLAFANAAASLSVQHLGARGGLPTRDEVERILIPSTTGTRRAQREDQELSE